MVQAYLLQQVWSDLNLEDAVEEGLQQTAVVLQRLKDDILRILHTQT